MFNRVSFLLLIVFCLNLLPVKIWANTDSYVIGGEELYKRDSNEKRNWVVKPRPYARNPQIGVFTYAKDVIYKYVGYYTRGASIILGEGESVVSVLMGDSSGWKFERLGNRLALKPINERATTNMILITNKRLYFFEVSAKRPKKGSNVLYEVRFEYPQEISQKLTDELGGKQEDTIPALSTPGLNFNYSYSGSKDISPVKVFDNGTFTYIEFPDQNAEIPAVFIVDSDGLEGLVNYRVKDNYLIVERVASLMTLKRGKEIICLFNEDNPYRYTGNNKLGTSKSEIKRREQFDSADRN